MERKRSIALFRKGERAASAHFPLRMRHSPRQTLPQLFLSCPKPFYHIFTEKEGEFCRPLKIFYE